jgi:uncharacterized protein with HEPN domain
MIEAAEAVGSFMAGRSRAELDSNRMLLFAVVRAIEVLGEAAARVSDETRQTAPVWKTVSSEIPALLLKLRVLGA